MKHIARSDLDAAAAAGLITPDQVAPLWNFLGPRVDAKPRFGLTHVLYYLGGMLAIGAMSLFMTLGWEQFGGWGVFFMALLYFGVAWRFAARFERQQLPIPMGIMATLAVVLVPLAVWGVQHGLGWWVDAPQADQYRDYHRYIDWRWLTLELSTLAAGVLMLWRWRAPFMVMPIAVTLWYMGMDLAMLLISPDETWVRGEAAWTFRKWFALSFGLITVLIAFLVDLRNRSPRDYGFWLYLFGLLGFWCALTSLGSGALAGKLAYLAINLALVLAGATLCRRTFTVFGALGVAIVLGDFSYHLFRDSWLFPIALSAIGLGVIYLGIWWNRHEGALAQHLQRHLPAQLQAMIARRHAAD